MAHGLRNRETTFDLEMLSFVLQEPRSPINKSVVEVEARNYILANVATNRSQKPNLNGSLIRYTAASNFSMVATKDLTASTLF